MTEATSARFIPTNKLEQYDLINEKGDDLGQVIAFVADMFTGRIAFAIVAFACFLGNLGQVVRRALADSGVVSRQEEVRRRYADQGPADSPGHEQGHVGGRSQAGQVLRSLRSGASVTRSPRASCLPSDDDDTDKPLSLVHSSCSSFLMWLSALVRSSGVYPVNCRRVVPPRS